MAQETDGKDQQQQKQPRPGQPVAPGLLQQPLGGQGAGAVVSQEGDGPVLPRARLSTERVKASHYPRGSGGARDRWGRSVTQAQPRVCHDREQRVGWGGLGARTLQALSQVATSWSLQLPFRSSSWLVSLKD